MRSTHRYPGIEKAARRTHPTSDIALSGGFVRVVFDLTGRDVSLLATKKIYLDLKSDL